MILRLADEASRALLGRGVAGLRAFGDLLSADRSLNARA